MWLSTLCTNYINGKKYYLSTWLKHMSVYLDKFILLIEKQKANVHNLENRYLYWFKTRIVIQNKTRNLGNRYLYWFKIVLKESKFSIKKICFFLRKKGYFLVGEWYYTITPHKGKTYLIRNNIVYQYDYHDIWHKRKT